MDDKVIEVSSDIKTIVVLNFVCYQAGTDIWGNDDINGPPKMEDGLVEIVGLGGYFHEVNIFL